MRKPLIGWAVLTAVAMAGIFTAASAQNSPIIAKSHLTLLGTGGGPISRKGRSQPANMLQVGGKTYLIDIGDGTSRQVVSAGVNLNAVDAVFITHLHFDHTAGLMGFMALDWQARRTKPVNFYGPAGTSPLIDNTLQALSSGEAIFRPQLPDLPAMRSVFFGHDWDINTPSKVYRDDTVVVSAVENSHYGTIHLLPTDHGINRSYSYRFDMADRSIVFTGDTGASQAVEGLAKNADILVSEIIDIDALIASLRRRQEATGINQQPLIDHMVQEHLTPESVGRMAAAAGVKMLILTHFATPPGIDTFNEAALQAAIRKHYSGPIIFGHDLDVF